MRAEPQRVVRASGSVAAQKRASSRFSLHTPRLRYVQQNMDTFRFMPCTEQTQSHAYWLLRVGWVRGVYISCFTVTCVEINYEDQTLTAGLERIISDCSELARCTYLWDLNGRLRLWVRFFVSSLAPAERLSRRWLYHC